MNKVKMIKVLQTIRQGEVGGGETHVLDLVKSLDKSMFEPVVLSFTDGPMVIRLREMGVKVYVVPTKMPFNITKWKNVRQILQNEKIDILHAHGTRACSNTLWAAKSLGLPVIYTVHGWSFHPDQSAVKKYMRILSERFLVNSTDLTICVSDNNLLEGYKYFKNNNATVIKNGVNLKKFDPVSAHKNIRAEFGIANDTLLVGYIARITHQKDPFTLIQAIKCIPESLNIKFLFIGDGDLKEAAIKLAHELGIQSKIIFSGFRLDVPDILNAIDIYCLPSLWEGLPIGLLEAMAMGKAVIATAIDGTKEIVEHNLNGLLFNSQSPQELAHSIMLLAADKGLRESFGGKAREKVKSRYSIEKMTKDVEKVYTNFAVSSVNYMAPVLFLNLL